MTPNDTYRGRTAPLTSKRFILYIYWTNIGTEHFKHDIFSPFFPLQNAVCSIILTNLVPVLFTFYIQDVLKLKKNNSGAKRLFWTPDCVKWSVHYLEPLSLNKEQKVQIGWKYGSIICMHLKTRNTFGDMWMENAQEEYI